MEEYCSEIVVTILWSLCDEIMNECSCLGQVKESRFTTAGYTCWLLALEFAQQLENREKLQIEEQEILAKYLLHKQRAEIYYAYSFIYQFTSEPFRTTSLETLFNISRFLMSQLSNQPPKGVSTVNILVTLAKHAEELGKLCVTRIFPVLIFFVHMFPPLNAQRIITKPSNGSTRSVGDKMNLNA